MIETDTETLLDCGTKNSIIRAFIRRNISVIRCPWNYNFLKEKADGVVISNGPGDPRRCNETIENVRRALSVNAPILGICLGSQILGLAAGASTYKLRYGHRSQNQPCVEVGTKRCYITTQNHGYAVDSDTLPEDWREWFYNNNDKTNEGIIHISKPFFGTQFHPEASPGIDDTEFLFDMFVKALKEEAIKTVLVNPNIATIQTSDYLANEVYFVPIDTFFVEKVIEKEKPDGVLLGFGGQTALNVGVELAKKGVFQKYDVKVLGTSIEAIQNTEDRDLFVKNLKEIDLQVPVSKAVNGIEEAIRAAKQIGYPVMCRIAYALGGLDSGVAYNKKQLIEITKRAFSSTRQILIEEYFGGWKEIEYEIVRDRYNNCIVVCSMENVDPMGIHTGESSKTSWYCW